DVGDVVIAVVNGELTVKRLSKRHGRLMLVPENQQYPPLPTTGASPSICAIQPTWSRIGLTLAHVKPAGGAACWGVAKGCIRLRVMGKGIGTTRRIGYQETWELPACHQQPPSRWPRQQRSRWGSARHLTRRPLRTLALVRRPALPD